MEEKHFLQQVIMGKQGVDDTEDWDRLKVVRAEIDSLYEEKLSLVHKVFNLTQKFVQELELQNQEQRKHI
jgi:hypothetical protein